MPLPPLEEPRELATRATALAKAVPATGYLFGTLMVGNLVQTASLATLPFSRRLFRRINRQAADSWWGQCVRVADLLHGTDLVLTGDELPVAENAVVIANHQQMPDINWLMKLARAKKRLGDLKWFVKDELKWVPGVGWGMVFLDCLFVKRDWARDEGTIVATFDRILRDDVPLWLILFPEGTRITPQKLRESNAYAARHGLPPTKHLLQPRTSGFAASVQGLRQHVAAVYDVTIGYELGVPTLWQYVKGYNRRAHLHVQRVPIAELPVESAGLASWLQQRFLQKDRRLDGFYETGRMS